MMTRPFLVALFALTAARPVRAQAAADTTLAGAVATVLADSLLDRLTDGPIVWRESSGSIDDAVANALRTHPKLRGPVRDPRHMMWIGIQHVAEQGDTTWVVVQFGQDYGGSGFLTLFIEDRAYLFTRTGGRWRFVRSQFLRHADGGPVRG
jgi:hypothetical protein